MFKVKTKYYTHKHKILPKIQNENLFSYYSMCMRKNIVLPIFKGAKLGGACAPALFLPSPEIYLIYPAKW